MTGIKPMVMPMFMNKCMKMQLATQYPYILVKFSLLLSASDIIRQIMKTYTRMTAKQPTKPHSSPTVQKMKSVLCSGTNP